MYEDALSVAVSHCNDTGALSEESYWALQWEIMLEEAPS